MQIKGIIANGKLKTYRHSGGFLEVYWQHPSLEANQYYLFLFEGLNCTFISVRPVCPQYLPVKHRAKVYVPIIDRVMKALAGAG